MTFSNVNNALKS